MWERGKPTSSWSDKRRSDKRLVAGCLDGSDEAWSALIDKYKNLVFSIIRRYHANREEAADIFQAVWLDAFNDLPKLRNQDVVRSWLISLTTHKCYHWKQKQRRQEAHEPSHIDGDEAAENLAVRPKFLEDLERQQWVREAVLRLPERCRELIHLLFFVFPPMPYQQVAHHLGLATGSIGFIRGRCLKRLKKLLEEQDLK